MKRIFLLAAALGLCLSLVPGRGNAITPPGLLPQNSQNTYDQPQSIKTFTGTVMEQGDVFVLSDKANKTNYQLDDPKKVREYEGKQVKVTGTLDAQNLTIHVETIAEVS
jgi:hypothetical protein